MTTPQLPFWSDDFDMDLPKIVPDWLELLGDTSDVKLKTHSDLTDGRINLPSTWGHTTYQNVAFFGREHPHKPEFYHTSKDVVECTFAEVVRDVWAHHYMAVVEEIPVVYGNWYRFERIMSHRRGWHTLGDDEVARHEAWASKWVRKAAYCLRGALWLSDNPSKVDVVERIR